MKLIKLFFILLVIISLLVILAMIFPDTGIMRRPWIFILWILHALSGLGLLIMTFRKRISGKVKTFLLIAGFSALGFPVGVVLHNLFYALGMLAEGIAILPAILGVLEGGFFLMAVILCQIGLLVGIIGTLIQWKHISEA